MFRWVWGVHKVNISWWQQWPSVCCICSICGGCCFISCFLTCDYNCSILTEEWPPYQVVSVLALVLACTIWVANGNTPYYFHLWLFSSFSILHMRKVHLTIFILLPNILDVQVSLGGDQVPGSRFEVVQGGWFQVVRWNRRRFLIGGQVIRWQVWSKSDSSAGKSHLPPEWSSTLPCWSSLHQPSTWYSTIIYFFVSGIGNIDDPSTSPAPAPLKH